MKLITAIIKNLKFHIIASFTNFLVVWLVQYIHFVIIERYIDWLFGIRAEPNVSYISAFSILVLPFISTFLIYITKKYSYHFYLIFSLLLLILFLLILFDIINTDPRFYKNTLDRITTITAHMVFKEHTLTSITLTSLSIFFVQTTIAKILLPKTKNKGYTE